MHLSNCLLVLVASSVLAGPIPGVSNLLKRAQRGSVRAIPNRPGAAALHPETLTVPGFPLGTGTPTSAVESDDSTGILTVTVKETTTVEAIETNTDSLPSTSQSTLSRLFSLTSSIQIEATIPSSPPTAQVSTAEAQSVQAQSALPTDLTSITTTSNGVVMVIYGTIQSGPASVTATAAPAVDVSSGISMTGLTATGTGTVSALSAVGSQMSLSSTETSMTMSMSTAASVTGSAAPAQGSLPVDGSFDHTGNLALALGLNEIYKQLTKNSPCDPKDPESKNACINGQFATCTANGTFTLSPCPGSQKCYALPFAEAYGATIQCADPATARNILGGGSMATSSTIGVMTSSFTAAAASVTGSMEYESATSVGASLSSMLSSMTSSQTLSSVTTIGAPTTTVAATSKSTTQLSALASATQTISTSLISMTTVSPTASLTTSLLTTSVIPTSTSIPPSLSSSSLSSILIEPVSSNAAVANTSPLSEGITTTQLLTLTTRTSVTSVVTSVATKYVY